MLALLIMVSASLSVSANNAKKTTTKKNQPAPTTLRSHIDSLSYAAGYSATSGLTDYIKQEYGIKKEQMPDFIEGFNEAIANIHDPKMVARYAGVAIAQMVNSRFLPSIRGTFAETPDSINEKLFAEGFVAAVKGDSTVYNMPKATEYFRSEAQAVTEAKEKAWKDKNTQWLADNAKQPGVKALPSGLQYKVITEGHGLIPSKEQRVTVKYEGKTIDGKVFDSSYKRNPQTSNFRCDEVIKGWTEALTMMPVGSKWELYIPQELAYGARQAGMIKPYSTLIFTVELEGIKEDPKPAAANDSTVKADKTKTGTTAPNAKPAKRRKK